MDTPPTHKKTALKAEVSSGLRAVNLVPDTDVRKNRQRARRPTFSRADILSAFGLTAQDVRWFHACDVLGGKLKTHTCTLCESR